MRLSLIRRNNNLHICLEYDATTASSANTYTASAVVTAKQKISKAHAAIYGKCYIFLLCVCFTLFAFFRLDWLRSQEEFLENQDMD